jgi:hypothetical protein
MRKRALAALGVVKAFTAKGPGGVELQLKVEATTGTADTGDPEEDLADLLATIGEVAETGGTSALFVVDEMQNLDPSSLAAICKASSHQPTRITGRPRGGWPTVPSGTAQGREAVRASLVHLSRDRPAQRRRSPPRAGRSCRTPGRQVCRGGRETGDRRHARLPVLHPGVRARHLE